MQCHRQVQPLSISSQFDGGNIELLAQPADTLVELAIQHDSQADFAQWFYFKASHGEQRECVFRITNAGDASYPGGWENYRAVASYDQENWFRVPTTYAGGVLEITHTPAQNQVYYAYFAPYPLPRLSGFLGRCQSADNCQGRVLGQTLDGRDLDMLVIGEEDAGHNVCWVIARQHPGETMASWWMEGFLERLLDPHDAVSETLLKRTVFYVVPNMNPDGGFRGNLRTNSSGANLNREWLNPTMERSPEVYLVREKMAQTGVDLALDVHGDEVLPYNFIAGAEGIPSWTPERQAGLSQFRDNLERIDPAFQNEFGYAKVAAKQANLTMCTNYLGETFGALSMTLEMPFKDAANLPNAIMGWSPQRCQALGRSCLLAIQLSDVLKKPA